MENKVLMASRSCSDFPTDAMDMDEAQELKRSSIMQLYPLNDDCRAAAAANNNPAVAVVPAAVAADDVSHRRSGRPENSWPHQSQQVTDHVEGAEFPFQVTTTGRIIRQVQSLRESYPVLDTPMAYSKFEEFETHEGAHWPRCYVYEHSGLGGRLEDNERHSNSAGSYKNNIFSEETHSPLYQSIHVNAYPCKYQSEYPESPEWYNCIDQHSGRYYRAYPESLGWYVHLDQTSGRYHWAHPELLGWYDYLDQEKLWMSKDHYYNHQAPPCDFVQFKKSPYCSYGNFRPDSDDLHYVDFRPGPGIYACVKGLKGGYEAFPAES